MLAPLHVHLLPELIPAGALRGGVAVIIDVLRASSTMITALENGASRVVPCGSPDEAWRVAASMENDLPLLGGERHGVRIEGFDLGNSPAEYTPAAVTGRPIVFTTTNGTKALLAAQDAEVILIGAFLNLSAIAERLLALNRPIHLICAGTDGGVTGEDVLFAGGLAAKLAGESHGHLWSMNDSATIATHHWRQATTESSATVAPADSLAAAMRLTKGGRNLIDLAFDRDIDLCSRIDAFQIVPTYEKSLSSIVNSAARNTQHG